MEYSLTIKRYGRHLNFDNLEELEEEVSRYFTQREIGIGIVNRLLDYTIATPKDGYLENSYKDITVCFCPEI